MQAPAKLKMCLQQAVKQRALSGSEIPVIRNGLTRVGLDGCGVGIGILADDPSLVKNGQPASHTKKVANVALHSQIGMAPGATCRFIHFQELHYSPAAMRDEPAGWLEEWQKRPALRLEYVSDCIANILINRPQDLRVVTPAYSVSKVQLVQELLGSLEVTNRNTGNFNAPNLRRMVYGPVPPASWAERCQRAFNFIDAMYERSPYLKQAQQRYLQVTQQAARQGLFIVVPTGNQHDYLPRSVQTKPGSEFNELARSPYVISVANIDTNQTPGNYADDRIEPTSSWGDGLTYNPTVSAPGSNVLTGNQGNPDDVDSGTSFSAPYVAGVLAIMLQRNPGLTFEQGRQILQASCVQPFGYHAAIYGAGVLNPLAAVNRAGFTLPANGWAL
jgi:hypothetical protein